MNQCPLCRTNYPDGQMFCPECGVRLVPVQPEREPEKKITIPEVPKAESKPRPSKVPVILLALCLIAALAGDALLFHRAAQYEDMYRTELIWRWDAEEKLQQTAAELEQTAAKLEHYDETVQRLEEAEAELGKYGELDSLCSHGTDAYYAEKYILVLGQSETRTAAIHWEKTGTASFNHSSSIDCEWSHEWSNAETSVVVTGRSPGYYLLTFTNDQDEDTFDILVIVTE